MRRFLLAMGCATCVAAAALAGCSKGGSSKGTAGSGGSAGTSSSGGAGGTTNPGGGASGGGGSGGVPSPYAQFAKLSDNATGLAFGKDTTGATVLFVSLGASNEVVKVTDKGAVGKVADIPAAAGLALQADGSLLVCGHAPGATNGVLWKIAPNGTKTSFVTNTQFQTLLAVAVAPDDHVVFSDATKVYGVDATGTNIIIVTGMATDPSALAFSKDGTELYIGSGDSGGVWSVQRSPTVGNYNTAAVTQLSTGATGLSALIVLSSADLVTLSSGGVYRMKPDGSGRQSVASPTGLDSPDGAARGIGAFGNYLYIGNGKSIVRLPFNDTAVSLPVR